MEIITFLILEDNPKFLDQTVKLIERQLTEVAGIDCKILTATTAKEALKRKAETSIDIHVIDIDLPGGGNGFTYLEEVAKGYEDDEPVLPVVVISDQENDAYRIKALDRFKVTGFIGKSKYDGKLALTALRRAVKMVRLLDEKKVTFRRPREVRIYKEKNVWAIERLPRGQKKMLVSIYDEEKNQIIKEEFSLKSSLLEVPGLFSSPTCMIRCHQSHLVNPLVIIGQRGDQLLLPFGEKVPLGGEYADNIEIYLG